MSAQLDFWDGAVERERQRIVALLETAYGRYDPRTGYLEQYIEGIRDFNKGKEGDGQLTGA